MEIFEAKTSLRAGKNMCWSRKLANNKKLAESSSRDIAK